MKKLILYCLFASFLVSHVSAQLNILVTETGGDVTIAYDGTLDPVNPQVSTPPPASSTAYIQGYNGPYNSILFRDDTTRVTTYTLTSFAGSPGWGAYVGTINATSFSGTSFVFTLNGSSGTLGLPEGHLSSDPISGSISFAGSTLTDLGYTAGDYAWSFGSANADQVINMSISAVPEPSHFAALVSAAVVSLLGSRRRRRAQSASWLNT